MTKRLAVYGSLREGFYNTYKFRVKKLSTHLIKGIDLYYRKDLPFPIAVKGKGSTVMEIIEVPDYAYKFGIKPMELESGYVLDKVTVDGKKYNVFLAGDKLLSYGWKKADESDWIKVAEKIFPKDSQARYNTYWIEAVKERDEERKRKREKMRE